MLLHGAPGRLRRTLNRDENSCLQSVRQWGCQASFASKSAVRRARRDCASGSRAGDMPGKRNSARDVRREPGPAGGGRLGGRQPRVLRRWRSP